MMRISGWLLMTLTIVGLIRPARADEADANPTIDRALAYLSREVSAWSRAHKCYSCHNNGDAARALYEAARLGHKVEQSATADTDTWLADPTRWDHNGGDGPFSDKVLARVAFTAGLAAAVKAGRVATGQPALIAVCRRLIGDQDSDGSWRVDVASPVGSPATYGRPLATWLAVDALRQADPVEFAPAIARGRAYLRQIQPTNAPTAAVVLLESVAEPAQTIAALAWFAKAQAPDGGWGPYSAAPAENFDTALGVLALSRHADQPQVRDQIRQGRAFLIANQNADGSWVETTRPTGNESYAQRLSTTGWATLALLAGSPPRAAQNLHQSPVNGNCASSANPTRPQSEPEVIMADPRNIAHDKKVQQEKKHHDEQVGPDNAAVAPQPGKKTPTVKETPTEEPVSSHATSQHHKDKTTGHVEEPNEVQAEVEAAEKNSGGV